MFGNANVGGFYPEASVNCLLTRLDCAGTRPSGSELDFHGNECLHLFLWFNTQVLLWGVCSL